MTRRLAAAALWLSAAACRHAPPPAAASPTVATYDGGVITAADVDRAVLDLPPAQRQPADGDLLSWYGRIARELALQRVLLAEARAAGLDQGPVFERSRQEARTLAAVSVFLEKTLPAPAPPTEAEIKSYFQSHADEFKTPHGRQTYHLFKRTEPGADPAPVVAEVARLRARVVAGEDFSALAARESDSESRHRGGLLGWVTPGSYGPELEKVVFSLEPKVPSQPIRTREGVHLFLVAADAPARTLTLAEVRGPIARRLLSERRNSAIERLVGTALPEGSFVPDAAQLRALAEGGDPAAVVLRFGDLAVTLGELQRRLLAGQAPPDAGAAANPALALVEALVERERIYRYCVAQGIDRTPEAEARVERLLDRELSSVRLQQRLLERVDRDPKRLTDYYEANRRRFSEPLRLRVQRLTVPLTAAGNEAMARLERARAELDAGRLDFARLGAELGGTLDEPAWRTLAELALREERPVSLAAELRAGRYSPPFRVRDRIEMVRVLERKEPVPLPFDRARDLVRMDFLVNRRHDEYGGFVEEVLAGRHYQPVAQELEALVRRPGAAG